MKTFTRIAGLALALGMTALASPALADDDDKAACADKAQGDACTDGDGDPGVCIPDDSDPVLTCEDDGGTGSSSGTGSSDDDDDSSSGTGSSDDDGSSSSTGGTGSDDDGSGDDDSAGGCTASPSAGSSYGGALLGFAVAFAAIARRRRTRGA